MKRLARIAPVPALVGIVIAAGWAAEVTVNSTNALRLAISRAKPGTTILIAPGNFSGELHFRDVSGNALSFIRKWSVRLSHFSLPAAPAGRRASEKWFIRGKCLVQDMRKPRAS